MLKQLVKNILPEKFHAPIGKIRWEITKRLNAVFACLLGLLIDRYSWSDHESLSFFDLLLRTFRYKMAGLGLPMTRNEKRLKTFRNFHYGKRAFILGNGPSLNKCDLSLLKDEITFGVNNIYLNSAKTGFHPTYYLVEDVLLAEDRSLQINSYHGAKVKFFGNYLKYCIKDAPDIVWLNIRTDYRDYKSFPHFSKNAARGLWVGGTVSYISLQLAYYMGFDEIYLIGFDHAYQIPKDVIFQRDVEAIVSTSDDPNHFTPDYFGKGYRWHDPQVERMEKAYRKANKNFKADGRKVYNATVGGHLEVFPRVDYQSLFLNEWK